MRSEVTPVMSAQECSYVTCRRMMNISDCHHPSTSPNMVWSGTARIAEVSGQSMFCSFLGEWQSEMLNTRLQVSLASPLRCHR